MSNSSAKSVTVVEGGRYIQMKWYPPPPMCTDIDICTKALGFGVVGVMWTDWRLFGE
jgi:hypothetical protein